MSHSFVTQSWIRRGSTGRIALVACALWAVPGIASAQLVPGWNTKQFTFEKIDADRVRLMREVEVEGEKGSANEGQKFFADELEMNIRTGELTAFGNVVFTSPEARVSAERVVFNTRSKRGTFYTASGIASLGERGEEDRSMFGTLEPDVYFYGEVIEKIDIDKYTISRGGFTTCVQPTPRWEIVSGKATINLDDYAILRNAVVRVKDVPVFYLPVLYYPIQEDDRATGFLLPTYGRSTYRGQSLSNAFFWAISRSQDATFLHDWFTSRGQGGGGEYRYILSPQSQGDFRAYALKENASSYQTETGSVTDPARNSYRLSSNIVQALPANLRARGRIDYFSNVTTEQLYDNNLYQANYSTRVVSGGVSGSWRALSLSGNYNRSESFYSSTDSFVSGSAPGITASYSGQRIANLPLYASVNVDASRVVWEQRRLTSTDDFGLTKIDLWPTLRAPLSRLSFLTLNTSIGYRVTSFSESLDEAQRQIDEPVTRRYADMRAEFVGPVVTRVFTPNNAFADRMKHLVEPAVTVQRITSIDNQAQIPTAASYEYIVGGVTRITYGVTNRLLVRKGDDSTADPGAASRGPAGAAPRGPAGVASAPREFLSVGINQSYYSNEAASRFDGNYSYSLFNRPPSNFSTVALIARSQPAQVVGLDFRMEYDPIAIERKLTGLGMNGTIRANTIEASAGWNKQNYQIGGAINSNHYVQQSTTVRLAQNRIGGTATFNYDIGRSTMLQQRYILNYSAQCCGIAFEYQAFDYPADPRFPVPQDRRFNFSFTLAGVGSFSNFFGTFGGRTY